MNVGGYACALLQYAFEDGLEGAAGYPLDAKKTTIATEKSIGVSLNPWAARRIVKILNQEYKRGCKARLNNRNC